MVAPAAFVAACQDPCSSREAEGHKEAYTGVDLGDDQGKTEVGRTEGIEEDRTADQVEVDKDTYWSLLRKNMNQTLM